MAVRYVTNEQGDRVAVLLDIEECERLREIEEDMEGLEALQAARETRRAIGRGEEEVISWDQAMREIREERGAFPSPLFPNP